MKICFKAFSLFFIIIFLLWYLYPYLLSNVGNLYLVRGILNQNSSYLERAILLLQYPIRSSLFDTFYKKRLERRKERAATFIDGYIPKDERIDKVLNPPYEPEYLVNQVIEGEYILWGYDLDEQGFEFNEKFDIWLYWKKIGDEEVDIRHLFVENLVINGGFEKTIEVGGNIPLGFERERFSNYTHPFLHRRIVVREGPDNLPTLCAQLNNSGNEASPSGYYSSVLKCEADTFYLISGWVLDIQEEFDDDRQEVSIGLAFPGAEIPEEQQNAMIAPVISKNNWTYYAGILRSPQNATVMRLQLINWGIGVVCFDNVVLIPLELPND